MKFRIEQGEGKCCQLVHSRTDLIKLLKGLKAESITDIRKVYKSGGSDSVMEIYKQYINR